MGKLTTNKDHLVRQVDQLLNSKSLENLNAEELQYITRQLLVDRLKDELKVELKKSNVDVESLLDRWIGTFDSDATRETYGKGLEIFFNWLDMHNKDVYNLNSIDIDDYVNYIKKQYPMNNSVRERIAAASSFFSFLERNDIITKNHFRGCARPPKPFETKGPDDVPGDAELDIIFGSLYEELEASGKGSEGKKRQARVLIGVLSVIVHHGIRCGALPSFTVDKNGRYRAESKGKEIRGALDIEVTGRLKELGFDRAKPFKEMKVNSIQKSFERFNKRLVLEGKLKTVYSLHDLRHYAAVKFYSEGKDIIATQRYLGHSSVAVTQVYLASLGSE